MHKEVELKLRVPLAKVRDLPRHPLFSGIEAQKNRLLNTYYDTPDLALKNRHLALRLRRKGWAVWLMTVKSDDSGAGGLAQRSEWEAPTQPGVFDFSIVSDEALSRFLKSHEPDLAPVFTTNFTRTAWKLRRGESLVEVAFDRGWINVPGKGRERICELELELLQGDCPDVLFDLALQLASDFVLHPEIRSKAERGYTRASDQLTQPVKGFVSLLHPQMSPVEAFRSTALSCLVQLQRNEGGAVAGQNPEFVHQARVALRRLRSAFKLFSPVLGDTFSGIYAPRWKALAADLGGARDWDVFLDETLAPLEEAFPGDSDLATIRRKGERAKAGAGKSAGSALTRMEYSQLLLAFSAALFRVKLSAVEGKGRASRLSLGKFAARRLEKRTDCIRLLLREHRKMNAEHRHDLRIEFKKLRYALEFFAPLISGKRLSAFQSSLSRIQDILGTLNDQVTASRLIKEMHPKGDEVPLTRGWIAGRSELLINALESELVKFSACKTPW